MKIILLTGLVFLFLAGFGQANGLKEENEIKLLLERQTTAWNKGDLKAFMQTYWNNDSLLFISKDGVNKGWQTAFNHYQKAYPGAVAMGRLAFELIKIKKLSAQYYYLVGKWMLKRSIGDLSGHFDLLLQKIKGKWVIICDHSS
ncbi:MAG: nuclear transport factor 2 family protein [Flavisolibacter sp.]